MLFINTSAKKIFTIIYQQLSKALITIIDETLEVIPGEDATWFQKFKEYPGSASISVLQEYLTRYNKLVKIDLSKVDISAILSELSKYFYNLIRHYNAYKIKRFKPPKRYTFMVVFLHESQKVLIDHLIQLHDQYISNICRECRNAHLKKLKLYKKRNERAIDRIEHFVDFVLAQNDDQVISINEIYSKSTKKSELQRARDDMHEYQVLSRFGYARLMRNRYSSMRRYFAEFIQLPFLAEKGSQALEQSIRLIQQLDAEEIHIVPDDINTQFIDSQLVGSIRDQQGKIKRNFWEMGIAIAIKDGFRSGDLYVVHSNKYASF